MPKVTITGTTEQVLDAMGFRTMESPVVGRHVRPRGTSERAIKNKKRGDAQRTITSAFKVVRNDPTQNNLRDRLLVAIRTVDMPTQDLLNIAETLLAK